MTASAGTQAPRMQTAGKPATESRDAGVFAEDDSGASDAAMMEPDAGPSCDDCCSDGFPRGMKNETPRRIATLMPSGDGVAVCPNGDVYVTAEGNGEVSRVSLERGEVEHWANLGDRRPAGITCDARNRLFVAIYSSQSGASIELDIRMITEKDRTTPLPALSSGPALQGLNGITAVPGVGVYATDTVSGRIILARETGADSFETRTAAEDLALANGLAYDGSTRTLYVAASRAGKVFKFQVAEDGALSERSEVSVRATVLVMDGLAVDEQHEVYITDYLGGAIIRASDGASIARIQNPASLAFRGGTLFVTDYRVMAPNLPGALYAIDLGVCGAPRER